MSEERQNNGLAIGLLGRRISVCVTAFRQCASQAWSARFSRDEATTNPVVSTAGPKRTRVTSFVALLTGRWVSRSSQTIGRVWEARVGRVGAGLPPRLASPRMQRGANMPSIVRCLSAFLSLAVCVSCSGDGQSTTSPTATPTPATTPSPTTTSGITSDAAFFTLVTQTEPFGSYTPFPDLAGNMSGILSGSSAHVPRIRVSMNATAFGVLQNGRLPSGATFPDGSIIFKEVLANSGMTNLYAVMSKDRSNALAGNGWLWAEYRPDGGTVFALANRGNVCTSCHSLNRGPQNDFVRSFERQQ